MPPLMDGVRSALMPFEPLVFGIQASCLSGNWSLPGLDPGGVYFSVSLSLCHPIFSFVNSMFIASWFFDVIGVAMSLVISAANSTKIAAGLLDVSPVPSSPAEFGGG